MKNVCVLFGGKSSEFFVSCKSAYTIINSISKDRYRVIPVGITQEGDWFLYEGETDLIPDAKWVNSTKKHPASFLTHSQFPGLTVFRDGQTEQIKIDVVFPVLHGKNGEDGTIQGLMDMLSIPYVGCGLLSSAVCMDKSYTKLIVEKLGIRQAPYYLLLEKDSPAERERKIQEAADAFGFPIFAKPCKAGSSCGVSKAKNLDELRDAVNLAFEHDDKVLLEKAIFGREIECAVLDNGTLIPSRVGEIRATADFYSYDAKYADASSVTDTDPDLRAGAVEEVQQAAMRIFRLLDCRGLSRIDFFLEHETGEIVFNEINTLPGFTGISMYPMLMKEVGFPLEKLVDELIESAFH
ncbi:MAG: D-alanine--D-alanine ligase [Clostridia bacterium]|nr:D-alanine--D-alanine ligase [Clostridia bacterium]